MVPIGLLLAMLGVFGLVVWFSTVGQIKRVEVTASKVLISNYLSTTEMPLHEIIDVSGTRFIRIDLIWIRFRRPTIFGPVIVFRPKIRLPPRWSEHSTVDLLRRLARAAQQREQ
jgi:hypothetical protein